MVKYSRGGNVVAVGKAKKQLVAYKNTQIIYLGDCEVKHWDELTQNQLKIAMYSAAKVKPEDTHETEYVMTFQEFSDLCKFESDGGTNYEKIYREARKLARSGVDFKNKDGEIIIFNWLDRVSISPKSGMVRYHLDPRLLPFYKTKKGTFAIVNLLDYMPLRGKYALLLFEFLAKWKNHGKVYQTIEDLRNQFHVPAGKYKRPYDFMAQIINRAVEEINEKVKHSFHVDVTEKRGKRSVVEGVTFYIKPINKKESSDVKNQDLIAMLVEVGVDVPAAQSIVEIYSKERITANLDLAKEIATKGKIKRSLAAAVCDAITNDYAEIEQVSMFIAQQRTEKKRRIEENQKIAAEIATGIEQIASTGEIQDPDLIAFINKIKAKK